MPQLPPDFLLTYGSHPSFSAGACIMEAVAYVAGERHSDHPVCVSPVLTQIAIALNDAYGEAERQLLAPLILKLVGTCTTREVDRKRAFAFTDAVIREIVPMGLDVAERSDLATQLRAIAPIVDAASALEAQKVTSAVQSAANYATTAHAYAAAANYAATAATAAYAAAYAAAAVTTRRRPIIVATIAAFERVIAIVE